MGVRSRSKRKRRRRASAGGADLISGLCDDVLLRILDLLPDTGDAVRTGALSRRWRGLWTRLTSLSFASRSRPVFSRDNNGVRRFASFINSAIAVRAAQTDPAVQHLAISFETPQEVLLRSVVSKAAAPRWIRDAMQHDVKTFTLELHHADTEGYDSKANPWGQYAVMSLGDDLPRSARMETMRLALGGATLRLPDTAAAFASLADLTLENMEFAVDSGHLLTRLLSSACCPRLKKLRLRKVSFATSRILEDELLIEAEELLELSLEEVIGEPDILRLRTPRLRVLRTVDADLSELTISAPMLEELLFDASQPFSIDTDGELPCVKSLRVELTSHADDGGGFHAEQNGVAFSLLHCCTTAACLDLDLYVFEEEQRPVDIIGGRIPQLPQVTYLTVHVSLYDLHSFGIGIADILAQCCNLKYLRICCTFRMEEQDNDLKSPFLCDHLDNWKSDVVYCLPHLKEVKFMGLAGTECEFWFVQSMLASTTQLHMVTISFDPKSSLKNRIQAFERITPLQGYGMWTCCHEPYLSLEWKPSL